MALNINEVHYEDLINHLESKLGAANLDEVQEYVASKKGSLVLLQWKLLSNLNKQKGSELVTGAIEMLLTDPKIMELLLTSGSVQEHKWSNAINLINQILDLDSEAKKGGYRLQLAVAIALTFSNPVKSFSNYNKTEIDPLELYQNFVRWVDEGVLFPIHTSLSAWNLRYVVGSWAEDEELEWARKNVLENFKTPEKIAEVTHKMVPYKEHNSTGESIHPKGGALFYNHQPKTLARLAELGAVCGGISMFGVAMAQAFGIPAVPVAQPGHCAFLWRKDGQWIISNDVGGIDTSIIHNGFQWS